MTQPYIPFDSLPIALKTLETCGAGSGNESLGFMRVAGDAFEPYPNLSGLALQSGRSTSRAMTAEAPTKRAPGVTFRVG